METETLQPAPSTHEWSGAQRNMARRAEEHGSASNKTSCVHDIPAGIELCATLCVMQPVPQCITPHARSSSWRRMQRQEMPTSVSTAARRAQSLWCVGSHFGSRGMEQWLNDGRTRGSVWWRQIVPWHSDSRETASLQTRLGDLSRLQFQTIDSIAKHQSKRSNLHQGEAQGGRGPGPRLSWRLCGGSTTSLVSMTSAFTSRPWVFPGFRFSVLGLQS